MSRGDFKNEEYSFLSNQRGIRSNKYRGNATGKLLIDLHKFYKFDEISDYMSGRFTISDVGKELKIIV